MKSSVLFLAVIAAFFWSPSQADTDLGSSRDHWLPTTPLLDVLDAVSHSSDRVFSIDDHVKTTVVLGQLNPEGMTYETLLLVLRNNGLAAYDSDGIVSIIPVVRIRQFGLPLLVDDKATVAAQEWVTRIVRLKHTSAKMFVPILRPLLPQQGHMVAHNESNSLLIVARYDNVQRIVAIITAMDIQEASQKQPQ